MEPQKIVFISFNQALHGLIIKTLSTLNLKGYTQWEEITGAGSSTGVPHLGSHAWPTLNGALLVACSEERAHRLLDALAKIDEENALQGLRAFMWNVERSV